MVHAGTEKLIIHIKKNDKDLANYDTQLKSTFQSIEGIAGINTDLTTGVFILHKINHDFIDTETIRKKIEALGLEMGECQSSNDEDEKSNATTKNHQHHATKHTYHNHAHDHAEHHHTTEKVSGKETAIPPNCAMTIKGMDCISCTQKIKIALNKIEQASNVNINFTTQILQLTLSGDLNQALNEVKKTITSLGFEVSNIRQLNGTLAIDMEDSTLSPTEDKIWWQTNKGRRVIWLGVFMAFAYVLSLLVPSYANYILALAVIIGVLPFIHIAFSLARLGSPFSIETLMSIASLGALLIGAEEEAAAVVFLFALGELLESVAADQARSGIKALQSLVPRSAILIDNNGQQRNVSLEQLKVDDIVLVRPGDKIPADGIIIEGQSNLDESPITGESIPVAKSVDDKIFAGSINTDGSLKIQVKKVAADNTIAKIIHLVEEAQSAKAPTARFIEEFSRYYTPIVMVLAALIIIVPPLLLGEEWHTWLYRGLALLLISCPCALVLSTPAAIASSLANATRRGILMKGGHILETIGKVDVIAFDKTGTLTKGKPTITNIVAFNHYTEDNVLEWAAAVESSSSHPLAGAIIQHAQNNQVKIPTVTNASTTAGKAVHGRVLDKNLLVGSPSYVATMAEFSTEARQQITTLEEEGNTVTILFDEDNKTMIGLIALRDEPRHEAKKAINGLKKLGIKSVMLTGDNRCTATAIANALGLESQAELLPQDKLNVIKELKSKQKVAMVGDGINDAPALATADVGIAVGSGTDVALETADATLLQSQITDLPYLITLSRSTMHNIYQNITFAIGLKVIFMISSIFGLTGLWIAVLADTGATAIVTINALRLLRFKARPTPIPNQYRPRKKITSSS